MWFQIKVAMSGGIWVGHILRIFLYLPTQFLARTALKFNEPVKG
jgi:hypothetical protein